MWELKKQYSVTYRARCTGLTGSREPTTLAISFNIDDETIYKTGVENREPSECVSACKPSMIIYAGVLRYLFEFGKTWE